MTSVTAGTPLMSEDESYVRPAGARFGLPAAADREDVMSDSLSCRRLAVGLSILLSGLLLARCGQGPTAPSGEIVLRGSLVGSSTSATALSTGRTQSAGAITVTVQGTAISTTVAADGSFTLRGLPEGSFTLVFTRDGAPLGQLTFDAVNANQEITITVRLSGDTVVLVDEQRTGIGHGDVEIEGLVQAVLVLDPAGESRFTIAGKTVAARPGQTAIREGNTARSVSDVTVGRQVHVKGVWLEPQGTSQAVLALEIKLQGPAGPSPSPSPSPSACAVGANAEVEGLITAKTASSITVNQQAKGDYLCDVSASTRIRKGNTSYTLAQLQLGWRVHVKGTTQGLAGTACRVTADEIMVQNN